MLHYNTKMGWIPVKNTRRIKHEGLSCKGSKYYSNNFSQGGSQTVINSKYFHFFAYLIFYQSEIIWSYHDNTVRIGLSLWSPSRRGWSESQVWSSRLCCGNKLLAKCGVVVVAGGGALWESDPVRGLTPGTPTSVKEGQGQAGVWGTVDQVISSLSSSQIYFSWPDWSWERGVGGSHRSRCRKTDLADLGQLQLRVPSCSQHYKYCAEEISYQT